MVTGLGWSRHSLRECNSNNYSSGVMQVGTQVKTLLSIIDPVKDNRHTCRIGIGNIIETILQFTYVIGMCISCTHSHACGKL